MLEHNQRCRLHLVNAGEIDDATAARTVTHLVELHREIIALTESMTQRGQPSSPKADASWIRALGWFTGWSFPLALAAASVPGSVPETVSGSVPER